MKTDEGRHVPIRIARSGALLLSALTIAAAVLPVRAQTFRGAIVGTVVDQSQAGVPGATVTVKNQATGLTRTAITDDAGNYDVPELPLGQYTVTITKEGFGTVSRSDVPVTVAAEQRVDQTLAPGKVRRRSR